MRYLLGCIILCLCCEVSFAADTLCLSKYKEINNNFYIYNEKSAISNAVMDRITSYNPSGSLPKIKLDDAKAWRAGMEDFIGIGQPILQKMLEYKALGCSPDQQAEMGTQIAKITEDLKVSRANLNSLISGLPASAFR